jgi:hypothetical protein
LARCCGQGEHAVALVGLAFLIILFAAFASRLVASASDKAPELIGGGRRVLRVNRGYAVMTGVGIGMIVLLLVLAPARAGKPLKAFPGVVGIVAACVAIGLPVVLATVRVRVEFDREVIRRRDMWGKRTEIRWDEIRQVSFNKMRLELALASASRKIGLNVHMIGFPDFLEVLKDRLDPALWRNPLLLLESTKRRL